METLILIALITLFLGIIIGYFIRQVVVRNQARSAEQKIKAQLEEAKTKAIDLLNYSASFYKKDCSQRITELATRLEQA